MRPHLTEAGRWPASALPAAERDDAVLHSFESSVLSPDGLTHTHTTHTGTHTHTYPRGLAPPTQALRPAVSGAATGLGQSVTRTYWRHSKTAFFPPTD
jgi:hypothetical protein